MRFLFLLLVTLLIAPAKATSNNVLNDLLAPTQQTFLPVTQAFEFDFDQQGRTLFIGWDIAPGYYLYKQKIEILAKDASIDVGSLGDGEIIEDEFFGKTEVFFQSVSIISKLSDVNEGAVVKVRYQGCAEAGLCYPPEVITIPLSVIAGEQSQNATPSNTASALTESTSQSDAAITKKDLS